MKTNRLYIVISACLALAGCTSDLIDSKPEQVAKGNNLIKEITVTLPNLESYDANTRTTFTSNETGISVVWDANDSIGIFPNEGYQVSFGTGTNGGSNSVTFTGGGWGLKTDGTYAAYFPFSVENFTRDNHTILMDYTGQTQKGDNSTSHLGKYDYLASGAVSPENGALNLQLKRLGSVVRIDLHIPAPELVGTYLTGAMVFSSDIPLVKKAELDISGPTPQVNVAEWSNALSVSLKDVKVQDDGNITIFMMLYPVDFDNIDIGVGLQGTFYDVPLENLEGFAYGSNHSFTYNLSSPRTLEAGKPYHFEDNVYTNIDVIYFYDDLTREICIANWDTNRDGGLSYDEASAVESIAWIFNGKDIASFRELQYFTSLTEIPTNAFAECTKLGESFSSNEDIIIFPPSVTTIRSAAFHNCTSLSRISIPNTVEVIEENVFSYCGSLSKVILPDGLTSIGNDTFYQCNSLSRLDLPNTITTIGDKAFYWCNGLAVTNIPAGLTFVGEDAFMDCSNLMIDLVIPGGLTTIKRQSFSQAGFTSLIIQEGVTTLDYYAFGNCEYLTTVDVAASVTSIANEAFMGCDLMESITFRNTTPPTIGDNVFDGTNNCPIYVPAEAVDTYKAAEGWSVYADRIQAIPVP